jgi:isocitrate/isopropylmalate dehydrogenase
LRSVRCNAEQSADRRIPEAAELCQQVAETLAQLQAATKKPVTDAGRRTSRTLYQQLLQLRQQLQQYVRPTEAELQAELNQVQQQLEANKILRSREFSFVLFTESVLAEMQADFC